MRPDLTAEALYSLEHTLAASLLRAVTYPWEALAGIRDCIRSLGPALSREEYDSPRPGVWIHKTARVFDSAYIGEDVILGAGPRCATALLSGVRPWWGTARWWEILPN